MTRVVVVGATRNFFKVGHTTFRRLAATEPDVKLRLGILDTTDARRAVTGMDVELIDWDPAEPATLDRVLVDCDRMLMVPPIDGRVRVAETYLDAAKRAGVDYILCLGIQHPASACTMAAEVAQVSQMLDNTGIPHDVLKLPVFLENLLYQIPSISERREFRYPVSADSRFCYLTCKDMGEVFARLLVQPPATPLEDTLWTSADELSCREWADYLSSATGNTIAFRSQSGADFVRGLESKGMSAHAARAVLELWERIDADGDVKPTSTFAELLGRAPTSAASWTTEHACCFGKADAGPCTHPTPPREHMF
jgi:NAD(P)H dehydrogenase (quinone)